jgi:hypothetical protein
VRVAAREHTHGFGPMALDRLTTRMGCRGHLAKCVLVCGLRARYTHTPSQRVTAMQWPATRSAALHTGGVVQVEGGERLLDRVRGLPRVVVRDLVAAPHTPAVRERKEVAAAGGE